MSYVDILVNEYDRSNSISVNRSIEYTAFNCIISQ